MKAFEKQLTQYPSRFTGTLIPVVFLFPLWGLGFSHNTYTTNHGVYGKCVRSPKSSLQETKILQEVLRGSTAESV